MIEKTTAPSSGYVCPRCGMYIGEGGLAHPCGCVTRLYEPQADYAQMLENAAIERIAAALERIAAALESSKTTLTTLSCCSRR